MDKENYLEDKLIADNKNEAKEWDAVINDVIRRQDVFDLLESNDDDYINRDAFYCDVEDIPAEATEIIRCADCQFWIRKKAQCGRQVCAEMGPNDYCSKGERKYR